MADTTFLSPFYFTPLIPTTPDGLPFADVVLSSLTKYGSGHSDIIMGNITISPRTVQQRPKIVKGFRFLQNSMGATASPRDCHLMVRSLKTLSVRMMRHGINALRLSAWLREQPQIESVRYPGLYSDVAFGMVERLLSANARRELAFLGWQLPFKQSTASAEDPGTIESVRSLGIPFGGMVSLKLKDVTESQAEKFATSLRLITLAESLGGVESLIEVPAGMTHQASRPEPGVSSQADQIGTARGHPGEAGYQS